MPKINEIRQETTPQSTPIQAIRPLTKDSGAVMANSFAQTLSGAGKYLGQMYEERKRTAYKRYDYMAEQTARDLANDYETAGDYSGFEEMRESRFNELKEKLSSEEFGEAYFNERGEILNEGFKLEMNRQRNKKEVELYSIELDKTLNAAADAFAASANIDEKKRFLAEGVQTINSASVLSLSKRQETNKNFQKLLRKKQEEYLTELIATDPAAAINMMSDKSFKEYAQKMGMSLYGLNEKAVKGLENKSKFDSYARIYTEGTEANKYYNLEEKPSVYSVMNNINLSDNDKKSVLVYFGYNEEAANKAVDEHKRSVFKDTLNQKLIELFDTSTDRLSSVSYRKNKGDVEELLDFKTLLTQGLVQGNITRDEFKKLSNTVLKAQYVLYDEMAAEKTGKIGTNPYAQGLNKLFVGLKASGYEDERTRNRAADRFLAVMQSYLDKNPAPSKEELEYIITSSVHDTAKLFPDLARIKQAVPIYYPSVLNKKVEEKYLNEIAYISSAEKEPTDDEKRLAYEKAVLAVKSQSNFEMNDAVANMLGKKLNEKTRAEFSKQLEKEDGRIKSLGLKKEDVLFSAQKYGKSITDILNLYERMKKD